MAQKKEVERLIFVRITLLGASGSGKTCLINSFVNNCCPTRYVSTEKAQIYHKKVEVTDDGEWEDIRQPVLVELEDTPGSEKGFDDDDDDGGGDDGPPDIQVKSRVTLHDKKDFLLKEMKDPKYGGKLLWKAAMEGMLGKDFPVKKKGKDGSIGLPSPDGSEGGVWNFPRSCVKLKVSLDLPIDQYLSLGEKEKVVFPNLKDRKLYTGALQFPYAAYPRPVGNPDHDRSLTKNRMGYFICFDISDDSGDSLKEAMHVHGMLMKSFEKNKSNKIKPIVWLVGCKEDRTSMFVAQRMNRASAQAWSDEAEVPFLRTAAKNHNKVTQTFSEMIQAICSRETLWALDAADDVNDAEETGGCISGVQ